MAHVVEFNLFAEDHDESDKEKVLVWLKELGLERYADQLQDEGFDHFSIIRNLDDDNIDELIRVCNMPRLHARQFRLALDRVREEQPAEPCKGSMSESQVADISKGVSELSLHAADAALFPASSAYGADEAGGIGTSSVSTTTCAEVVLGSDSWECPNCGNENEPKQSRCQECSAVLGTRAKAAPKKPAMVLQTKKQSEKNRRKRANKKAKRDEDWMYFEDCIEVQVTTSERGVVLEFRCSLLDTVATIKRSIQDSLKVLTSAQKLVLGGKVLEHDDSTLQHLGATDAKPFSVLLVNAKTTFDHNDLRGVWVSDKGKCEIFLDPRTYRLSYEENIDIGGRLHGWLIQKQDQSWHSALWLLEEDEEPWYGPAWGEEPMKVGEIMLKLYPGLPPSLETQIQDESTDWLEPVTWFKESNTSKVKSMDKPSRGPDASL